jgi:hypothetical protein
VHIPQTREGSEKKACYRQPGFVRILTTVMK